MLPVTLITFREVLEAALIVATIVGILHKLGQSRLLSSVWWGTATATLVSLLILLGGAIAGEKIQQILRPGTEELVEGALLIISALFITWAVFWLHKYFGRHKLELLQSIKATVAAGSVVGLFTLVFTAVVREGMEIALFLATTYLTTSAASILLGVVVGTTLALLIAGLFFKATLRAPVYRMFQFTTVLLILFAAGQLARGVHELAETGVIAEGAKITLAFLPAKDQLIAQLLRSLFGWARSMSYLELTIYAAYIAIMRWYVYIRKNSSVER